MSALFIYEIGLKSLCFVDNVHKLLIKILNKYKLFENFGRACKIELIIK